MLFIVSSTGGLKKPYSSLVFKILTINPQNKKTRIYSWIAFCRNGKMWVENQTKTRLWEDSSLSPETSTKNAVQEFHLWFPWSMPFDLWPFRSLVLMPSNKLLSCSLQRLQDRHVQFIYLSLHVHHRGIVFAWIVTELKGGGGGVAALNP